MTATASLVDDVPRLQVVGTELSLALPAIRPSVLTGAEDVVAFTTPQAVYVTSVFIN